MVAFGFVALWAVSACVVLYSVAEDLGGMEFVPAGCSPSPGSRAEGPALGTSGSTDLWCISARCCIACRDIALVLQHNLPYWKRGLQGELAALYQGTTRAVQDKLSHNVSCRLLCSSC